MNVSRLRFETRIAVIYLFFGGIWILFSDILLGNLFPNLYLLTKIQTYKGWAFVAASALLIYVLLHRSLAREAKTQAALNNVNELYRLLYENSLDAILLTTPAGSILAANPAACHLFERTEVEICQLGRDGLIDVSDPHLQQALVERTYTGKFTGELTFIRKNGERFACEVSSALFADQSGEIRTSMIIRDISERKRTEAWLRQSEEKFNRAFHNSPDAITITRAADGLLVEVNASFERISGYTSAEVLGQSSLELDLWVNPKDRESYVTLLKEQGQIRDFETVFRTKTGEMRNFILTGEIYESQGEHYIIGIIRDITERQKAEARLRESEMRFRAITTNTPDHILVQDRELRYTLVINPQLGLTEQDMLGKKDTDFLGPDEAAKLTKIKLEVIKAGLEKHFETSLVAKNGKIEYFDGVYVPKQDPDGQISGLIGYFRNITERKQAEDELIKSRDKLKNVLDSIKDAFITLDHDWRITYINPEAARINKKKPEEFLGKTHWEEWPASIGTQVEQQYKKAMAEHIPVHFEHQYYVDSVYDVWLDIHAYPGDEGLTIYYRDITEQKHARMELRQAVARLAEAQESERLALSKELHDQVGQGLTALSINLNLLRSKIGNETPKALATQFDSPLELVTEITEKIRGVMAELHPPVLEDYGLAAALRWYTERLANQTGLKISVTGELIEPRLPLATSMALFRIAQEALTNVLKHAEASCASLNLINQDGETILEIADNGRGFVLRETERAEQVHWGLTTMRERAELLNGRLKIDSTPGQGTKISVTIPR